MARIAILTDSTASIPDDWKENYGIHTIPLKLHWEEQTLLDGQDITPTEFYQRVVNSTTIPTTSQPSPQDFLNKFETLMQEYDGILVLPLSSGISGTYSSAVTAVESFNKIPVTVVDSGTTGGALGFVALAAARAAAQGAGLAEVKQAALTVMQSLHLYFVVDTLTYLHRGGRIGGAARFFGTALSIKPILTINGDGKINSLEQVRTKQKAMERLIGITQENSNGYPIHLGVLHANALQAAQALREQLLGCLSCKEEYVFEISPVIGAHVGPGTVGVACYSEIS